MKVEKKGSPRGGSSSLRLPYLGTTRPMVAGNIIHGEKKSVVVRGQ